MIFYWIVKKNNKSFTAYNSIKHKELWKAYRINAKNSVEHISPQDPSFERHRLCNINLNHFGNLALVTRSINSSYGNNAFNMKRIKFEEKVNDGRIDALKLYLIYNYWDENSWNDDSAERHQIDMALILERYFNQNN